MKINVQQGDITKNRSDAIVVFCYEDDLLPDGVAKKIDESFENIISEMINIGDMKGKSKEAQIVYIPNSKKIKRIIIVGMGKKKETDPEKIRVAFSIAAKKARDLRLNNLAITPDLGIKDIPVTWIVGAAIEGIKLGLYQFTAFKTEERKNYHEIKEIVIWNKDSYNFKEVKDAVKEAEKISDGVILARNLVSMPSNEMTPKAMAQAAMAIADVRKSIRVRIMNKIEMKRLGMNAFLGVARGSREEPQFIIMDYKGDKGNTPPIVLIGKGLTFDSGGISIKPAENMEEMKTDMAGGAAVLGTVMVAADLKLPLHIIGLIPATENMPGGCAYKPGDVLKTMSGLTVEVISTDAEGRLIIADALAYAQKYKPSAMIDVATLTGACIVALGEYVIGMMGTDEKLKKKLKNASEYTGEMLWELPLFPDFDEAIKSDIADLKNVGGRPAGAITAGAFLRKFAGDYPWVHLDIAGPSWVKQAKPYIPKGASGVGVRLLIKMLKDWSVN